MFNHPFRKPFFKYFVFRSTTNHFKLNDLPESQINTNLQDNAYSALKRYGIVHKLKFVITENIVIYEM